MTPKQRQHADAQNAEIARLDAQVERLSFAMRTVLGDGYHGQPQTWEDRIRIAREALDWKNPPC